MACFLFCSVLVFFLAYFDYSGETCGGKLTWNKIVKMLLLWQSGVFYFSVIEINDTVPWYIGMSLDRILHPVATPAACLKLGSRVSASRPSCAQRLAEKQRQGRSKTRTAGVPCPPMLGSPYGYEAWMTSDLVEMTLLQWNTRAGLGERQDVYHWATHPPHSEPLGVEEPGSGAGNGGSSDVGTKDWLAQQSGTGMFLQSSPGPEEGTWALGSCMM